MSDLVMRGAVRCGIEDSSCSSRAARVAAAMAQVLDAPLALAVIIPAPMQSSEAAA